MGETYCEIDDHYIGYVEFFEHWWRRWAKERGRRMNQKRCTTCPYVDVNKMSYERYCSAKDYEPIKLRWHKYRPEWCPRVEKNWRAKDEDTL